MKLRDTAENRDGCIAAWYVMKESCYPGDQTVLLDIVRFAVCKIVGRVFITARVCKSLRESAEMIRCNPDKDRYVRPS